MEGSRIVAEVIVIGIGFILTNIVAFIIFVVRMNVKLEKIQTQIDADKKSFDLEILEIKADMEDQRIAHDKRIQDVSDSLHRHYAGFHDENNIAHSDIKRNVEFIKSAVTEIQQNVAYMSGVLDQHINNGNGHSQPSPPRKKKVIKDS